MLTTFVKIMCPQILIFFYVVVTFFIKPKHIGFRCTPQEIVHILFLNCYKKQEHFGQIKLLYLQSTILFCLCYPLLPYTNDNDNNGSRPPILNITLEFSNGIHVD